MKMSGNRLRCNKKLAAAVTLALVSSIGAPAWAGGASDETVGKAQYGGGTGQSTVRVFHDMDNDPDRIMTGSSYKESTTIGLGISGYSAYHYLVLGNEDFPKNGLFVGRNSAGSTQGKWDNVMQQGADKYGGTYQQIVCVLPDGTKLNTVITAANCNQQGTFDAIVEVVNEYASRPEVAKAVMEAYYAGKQPDGSVDKKAVAEALGKILPKFYYADTSGNYEEGALVPIASIQMGNIDVQQTGANSKPPRPVDMNVKTYDSKNVATGSSWRPLDRQVTYGEDGYITGGKWSTHLRYQMLWGSDGVLHLEEESNAVNPSDGTNFGTNAKGEIVNTGGTVITVGALNVAAGGVVDLSYANTRIDPQFGRPIVSYWRESSSTMPGGDTTAGGSVWYPTGYYEDQYVDGKLTSVSVDRIPKRMLYADQATLAEGAVFRVGSYGWRGSSKYNDSNEVVQFIEAGEQDQIFIKNAEQADKDNGKTRLYVQLGWVPGVGEVPAGMAQNTDKSGFSRDTVVLGILNGGDKFEVEGQKSIADGIFSYYEITPVIGKWEKYFNTSGENDEYGNPKKEAGTAWYLESYTYKNTGLIGESGQSASDNFIVTNNLWRSNYNNLFRQIGGVHRSGLGADTAAVGGLGKQNEADAQETLDPADLRETVWSEAWHGKYSSAGGYGRSVSQSYNGMQVGYDKLLKKPYFGGKMFLGAYLMKLDGKSHTATGSGEQDSLGGGLYASWNGAKGHFFDAALLAAQLQNEYKFAGPLTIGTTGRVTGDMSTWAYGLGAQYGYQGKFGSGWFYEPSAGIFAGRTEKTDYVLSNGLGIRQGGSDTLMGRLGLRFGKDLGTDGNIYGGFAVAREFAGGASLGQFMSGMSEHLQTAGGKDSWYELSLGGNVKISPTGVFDLSYTRMLGSDIGNEWNINGMLKWSWGAAGSKKIKKQEETAEQAAVSGKPGSSYSKVTAPTVIVGKDNPALAEQATEAGNKDAAVANVQLPQLDSSKAMAVQLAAATATGAGEQSNAAVGDTVNKAAADIAANRNKVVFDTGVASGSIEEDMGEFELGAVTVEAARPDWEKNLSPGQVSVVYPSQFEGEQKDLPTMLLRVPGLFIQRVSGAGHYTVARVRGSTGAQVNVYVDGVLMNLNGDAAVNLSTIPVDNVERIEVYRGYVPARFSGSPLGGVINIVTKKPQQASGRVTQGFKSYGGYNATYEYNTPLGSGSLLATYQRDIWKGDFDFLAGRGSSIDNSTGDMKYRNNGYQNSNGMLKWQDEHWTAKASWKKLHEEIPINVGDMWKHPYDPQNQHFSHAYEKYIGGYSDREQDIDQKEFQIGRRDTVGKLDWGWRVAYLHSKKYYRYTGAMRDPDYNENFDPAVGCGYYWGDYISKKWSGNLNAAYKLGSSQLLEANFDYSREKMDVDMDNIDEYYKYYGSRLPGGRQYLRKYNINEYHFTLQDTIMLNDDGDFKLTPVFRADRVEMDTMSTNDKSWKYSGGAALQKQIDKHWSFKTTWGTYNRHPNFYEIFGDGGNIKPSFGSSWGSVYNFWSIDGKGTWERGTQFDFSLNWQGRMAKADTDTVLTWFQRQADRQYILFMPMLPNTPSTYYPISNVEVRGVELSHNMQWRRLGLTLAATWQKAEYRDTTLNTLGLKNAVTMTPEWVVNARLDYRFPGDKLSMFAEYNYTDKQSLDGGYLGSDTIDKKYANWLSSLATVDLGLKYVFDKNWKLDFGVNDIFDKGYDQHVSYIFSDSQRTPPYPQAGRIFYTTLEYRF
jgi:outer membrane autotransporter protein